MAGQGMNSWASVAPESTYGTKAASGWDYFDFVSEDIKVERDTNVRKSLRSPTVRSTYQGPQKIGGTMTMEMLYEGLLYFIKHGMGGYAYTVNSPVTGANLHSFSLADALPTGLSMEIMRADTPDDKVFVYKGGKVDTLEFACKTGECMTMAAGMIFQDEDTDQTASATPTYPGDYPVLWRYAGSLTLCGETSVPFDSVSVKLANNLSKDRFLMNETLRSPLRNDLRMIEGEVVSEYDSLALYAKYLAHTVGGMTLTFTSDSLITGTTYRSMTITLPGIRLKAGTPTISGPGIMPYSLPFIGVYNAAEPLTIQVVSAETTLA